MPQGLKLYGTVEKPYFLPCHQGSGAPSFALFAKGGMPPLFPPRRYPATSAYPTLRRKREGWGTRFSSPWVSHRYKTEFSATCKDGN